MNNLDNLKTLIDIAKVANAYPDDIDMVESNENISLFSLNYKNYNLLLSFDKRPSLNYIKEQIDILYSFKEDLENYF